MSRSDLEQAAARLNGAIQPTIQRRTRNADDGEGRQRALKPEWASALQHIGRQGKSSLDDMMKWSDDEGAGIKRNTLRSQMSIYADRGWVVRVTDGIYRLTDEGMAKCGLLPKAKNDGGDLIGSQVAPSSDGDSPVRDPAPTA